MINIGDLSKIHLKAITSSDKYISDYIDGDNEFNMFMQDMDHATGGFTKTSCRTYNSASLLTDYHHFTERVYFPILFKPNDLS